MILSYLKVSSPLNSSNFRVISGQQTRTELSVASAARSSTTSVVRAAKDAIAARRVDGASEIVKSITFVAAFTFHSSLEGFAFGVQV